MKGFGADPNVSPYIDDIHAYLQTCVDGALGRCRLINWGNNENRNTCRGHPWKLASVLCQTSR